MQGCVLGFYRSRGEGCTEGGHLLDGVPPTAKVFLAWAGGEEVLSWESRIEVVGVRGQNLNWGWALARWVTTPGGEQVEPRVRFTQGCTWYQDEYPRLVGGHNVDRACREVVGWGSGRSFGVARGVASGQKLAIGAHCWVCRGWVGESVQGPVVRSVVGR